MRDSVVRLSEILIQNFKNIQKGQFSFYNRRKNIGQVFWVYMVRMVLVKQL